MSIVLSSELSRKKGRHFEAQPNYAVLRTEQDTQCNTGESPYPRGHARVSPGYQPLTKKPEDSESEINATNTLSPPNWLLSLIVYLLWGQAISLSLVVYKNKNLAAIFCVFQLCLVDVSHLTAIFSFAFLPLSVNDYKECENNTYQVFCLAWTLHSSLVLVVLKSFFFSWWIAKPFSVKWKAVLWLISPAKHILYINCSWRINCSSATLSCCFKRYFMLSPTCGIVKGWWYYIW